MTLKSKTGRKVTWIVVIALAAATAAYFLVDWNGSAQDRIAADPPPQLFSSKAVAPLAQDIAGQQHEARLRMAPWWKAHGNVRDDQAFIKWVIAQAPKPPSAAARRHELSDLEALARHRSSAGTTAADWLERNGKKDIWRVYAHDQGEWAKPALADREKADVKAAVKIAKKISTGVVARHPASAPFVLDRKLQGGIHDVRGKLDSEKRPCPCSYPSNHSIKAAAARTVLESGSPIRAAEYRWMESEIDYSRLYMAGHFKSDVLAGTLLGDMVGMYIEGAHGGPTVWPSA